MGPQHHLLSTAAPGAGHSHRCSAHSGRRHVAHSLCVCGRHPGEPVGPGFACAELAPPKTLLTCGPRGVTPGCAGLSPAESAGHACPVSVCRPQLNPCGVGCASLQAPSEDVTWTAFLFSPGQEAGAPWGEAGGGARRGPGLEPVGEESGGGGSCWERQEGPRGRGRRWPWAPRGHLVPAPPRGLAACARERLPVDSSAPPRLLSSPSPGDTPVPCPGPACPQGHVGAQAAFTPPLISHVCVAPGVSGGLSEGGHSCAGDGA